jgi:hypothetical protein
MFKIGNKRKKILSKIVFLLIVFNLVFFTVAMPQPARAQWITNDLGQTIANFFHIPRDIYMDIYTFLYNAREEVAKVAFKTALRKLVHNLAYDSAVYVATGDKGQSPMFQTNFGDYIKKEGDAFLGDALNNQLKNMWGVDLCQPLDPLFKVRFEIAVKNTFRNSRPSCTFSKMMKNIRDVRKLKLVDLPKFAEIFRPGSNELGMFMQVTSQLQEKQRQKVELAKLNLLINQGWKATRSKISGEIKTPAIFNQLIGTEPFKWSFQEKNTFTGSLAADFVGTFTNTLLNKLLDKYKKGLYNPKNKAGTGLASSLGNSSLVTGGSPIQAAKERFAGLNKFNYNFGGPFNLVNKLSCNEQSEEAQQQYSCVIDDDLRSALLEAPHVTVGAAIERGLLHQDWPLGYRADKSGGTDLISKNIYSYRTLVILRKYRIIPVGWELAAKYYALYDKSGKALTLKRLIDNYDNPNSPYYRLVDPNWVLKAPQTICQREGPGEITSKQTIKIPTDKNKDGKIGEDEYIQMPIRLPYCADERTCIKEKDDGSGCLYYGYCTEDKPIWRIHSDNGACVPLYNSCQVFTRRNGSQVAYLTNTVWGQDTCDLASVGCHKYATELDIQTGEWQEDGPIIYLNRNAGDNECQPEEAGCSRFIRLNQAVFQEGSDGNQLSYVQALSELQAVSDSDGDGQPDNDGTFEQVVKYDFSPITKLKLAPAYLGCQGYTQVIGGDKDHCSGYWRDDINQCVQSGSAACQNYLLSCSANDLGCRFYVPDSYQGPQIPGVISDSDQCPAECVGYQSYLEQPSFLEPEVAVGRNPLSFIAKTARICSAAENGCEEFTNLSEGNEGEQKEYFSAVRSCILPNNPNVATYYTWASSDEAGNQLKSWQLLKSNIGEYPCTNTLTQSDGTVVCTDDQNQPWQCSFGSADPDFNPIYNPDCVEFVAQSGSSYWMRYSRVAFSSDNCVPMRRTKTGEIYSINKEQSKACSAQAVGCREYKGSTAENIKVVLNDDFEDGTNQGWQGGSLSNESLIANGHSLRLDSQTSLLSKEVTSLVRQGAAYKLSFWVKGTSEEAGAVGEIYFAGDDGSKINFTLPSGGLSLSNEWQRYEANLNDFNHVVGAMETLNFLANGPDGGNFYIDNIILSQTKDDLYLIQDSWQTPANCTQVVDGRDMLGCEAYKDISGQNYYLRSFDHLCRDELVGCEAMIDMHNSLNPNEESYNLDNSDSSDDVIVPADDLVYMVYDRAKICHQVGCQALGLFKKSRDGVSLETKYLVNDANKYGKEQNPLCTADKEGCEEFKLKDGGSKYFFDPGEFVCEYKQVNGNYGWYETGTNLLCPLINSVDQTQTGHCLGGRSKDGSLANECHQGGDCINYATKSDYGNCSQWTALCPAEENNCTEYQDPANPEGCNKQALYGQNNACDYYYYRSDKVETCSESELGKGCQAFHQVGGETDIYYSTPRCTGDVQRKCETDNDCVDENGNNLGSCSYIAPQGQPEQDTRPPVEINDGAVNENDGSGSVQ